MRVREAAVAGEERVSRAAVAAVECARSLVRSLARARTRGHFNVKVSLTVDRKLRARRALVGYPRPTCHAVACCSVRSCDVHTRTAPIDRFCGRGQHAVKKRKKVKKRSALIASLINYRIDVRVDSSTAHAIFQSRRYSSTFYILVRRCFIIINLDRQLSLMFYLFLKDSIYGTIRERR